jgi:cell shape-determining protein MreC
MRLLEKLSKKRLLVILMGVSLVTALFGSPLAGRVRVLTQWVIAPFGDVGMYVTNTVQTSVGRPRIITAEELALLEEENRVLTAINVDLVTKLRDLKRKLSELDSILNIFGWTRGSEFPYKLVPARVVAKDSIRYGSSGFVSYGGPRDVPDGSRVTTRHLLTDLSKALQEKLQALGLAQTQSKLASCVLVGRLRKTGSFGGSLQLVTDPGFGINARILRRIEKPRMITIIESDRARTEPLTEANNKPVPAFAEGDGQGLTIRDIRESDNVLPGDVLQTCEDGFVPTALLIGTVVRVTSDAERPGRVIVRVRPAVDLRKLRFVYIVIPSALGPQR